MAARFWSDGFDMDLPRIVPLDDALGTAADIPLWTHGGESYGRLNHPSVWNDNAGLVAYFGTTPGTTGKPESCYTPWPVVECTWREVARDAWVHTYLVLVDGEPIWDTTRFLNAFDALMYHVRGYRKLPDCEGDRLRSDVFASLVVATAQLTEHIEAVAR
jgi:hypothetical protein